MDSIFLLDDGHRASFLRQMMQSLDCVYICLWSYLPPPSNCLLALDGLYGETSNQPSLARQLFNVYLESVTYVDIGRIPGLAFKNNIPYMELKLHDFQRLVSGEVQLQFYREAGIKTIVFVGCAAGEIELGMTNDPQTDLLKEMNNLISLQAAAIALDRPSSSSSSLHSLSVDSPEYPPRSYLSSFVQEPIQQPLDAKQPLSQIRSVQLPTIESEDAAMTKAILAVLSSPSNSSSSAPQNLPPPPPPPPPPISNRSTTAFTRYGASSSGVRGIPPVQRQNKFKRAVLFFRNLNMRRRQELEVQENRPSVTQLHHMISERRRREKLNQSFHILRSLLPLGSKKDKASVLSSTTEYLSSLKSEMVELVKKNQMLESQLSGRKSEARTVDIHVGSSSTAERVNVEITEVSSSTSEARFLDLRVSVRGESRLLDLITRLIGYLKQQRNLSLLSLESNTSMSGGVQVHGVMMRLKIEGDEFDDSGFEEGVRRVADDQAH
ncbi:hypothetical protein ACS0TY_033779 [Phlomoides rotata]